MHGSNLDHMPHLLTLEYAVSPASGHAGDVQQLGAVYEVAVYDPGQEQTVSLRDRTV